MSASSRPQEERVFLSLLPPSDGQRTLALGVVMVSAIVFAALAPFAKVPVGPVAAFILIYQSALAINELITAVLLFGQASMLRSRGILVLAAGYLFTALIVIPHTMTFPGAFAPTGLLGAGPQSTAWLYMLWHVGFPIAVLAYALLKRSDADRISGSMQASILASITIVIAAVVGIAALATAGHSVLPPLMQGSHFTPTQIVVINLVWMFSAAALLVLWRQRPYSVLDLWLMVVMCAWVLDVMLSGVLNAARFDLGFYAGRAYGLMAASFVLLVLLLETRALYARLARSLAAERNLAETRADEAEALNRALQQSEERLKQLNETLEARVIERTQRLEAEVAEREKTQERLRETQKVEAVGRLAGGMAHDFNNLLTVIQGHLDVLMDDADEKAKESLKAIDHAAENGARMTRQLLTFSRRKEVKPAVLDLRWKPEGMDQLLRQSLRGDIRMVVAMDEDIWPVECDPGDLEMAMMNLCVNARDAMPNGGLVRIEGRNVSGEISDDRGNALNGEFVAVSVLDTGGGIPPEIMSRVFEPFFTTKEAGRGTGLGLSQVFGFAHQSGGLVSIGSVIGGGTSVTIYLPRAKTLPAEVPPPGSKSRLVGRGTVLLVEDDDDVAAITMKMLAMLGYESHHVREAGTALALLLGGRRFVLILSDIVMPGGLSGLEFGRKVRKHFPSMPILLASGYSSSAAEVSEAGFAFIAKPFRADGLADVLRRTIEEEGREGRLSA
jgi:signal transduction histidine kinase/ActR/RegA family two-component response regulator